MMKKKDSVDGAPHHGVLQDMHSCCNVFEKARLSGQKTTKTEWVGSEVVEGICFAG